MKTKPVVLIAKRRRISDAHYWQYRLEFDNEIHLVETKGQFLNQLDMLFTEIITKHYSPTTEIIVMPLSLPTIFEAEVVKNFPNITIVIPPNVSTRERLRHLLDHKRKRPMTITEHAKQQNTLYIATDAGGSSDLKGTNIWAWVKESYTKPTYKFNTTPMKHVHLAELEAILRAIIDNHKIHPDKNIHVYCDSTVAIESYEAYLNEGKLINLTNDPYLLPLLLQVEKINQKIKIVIEWTPSHSNYYLNEMADTLVSLNHPRNSSSYPSQSVEALVTLFSKRFYTP